MTSASQSSLITVIGRGHSGTRAMSHTLTESGVFMGAPLNQSGDLLPPGKLYEACRLAGPRVRYAGHYRWDFGELLTRPAGDAIDGLVREYLGSVLGSPAPRRGWKLPETILILPYIIRMFPEARYIFWVRDPRDAILGAHLTDDLADFNIPYPACQDTILKRAISWKYQMEIFKVTPAPQHLLEVRYEDFILRQDETLARLTQFLGFPLAKIPVNPTRIGLWRDRPDLPDLHFLDEDLERLGYERS